jgi:hypothetical protein
VRCEDAFGHVVTANLHQSFTAFKAEVLTNLRVQGLPPQYMIWQLLPKRHDADGGDSRPLLSLVDLSGADLAKGLFVALTTPEWEAARAEENLENFENFETSDKPKKPQQSPMMPVMPNVLTKVAPTKVVSVRAPAGLPSSALRWHS